MQNNHRKTIAFLGMLFLFGPGPIFAANSGMKSEVDFVNPFIGTAEKGEGGMMPCVGAPFAMSKFVAQTDENKIGRMPYYYDHRSIFGFMVTHQPTVWMGDYGYVSLMPEVGELKLLPQQRALTRVHNTQIAKPYYYSVDLDAGNSNRIKGEITSASRCGIFRFTFPQADQAHFVIQAINLNPALADGVNDLGPRLKTLKGYVKVDPEKREVTGYNPDYQSAQLEPELKNFKGYFILQFDKSFAEFGTWNGGKARPGELEESGTQMGAYISFRTKESEPIMVRVATSFISLEQARENLAREVPDWDFDRLAQSTRDAWQRSLSRLQVEGASDDDKAVFYTAIFHCLQYPREFSEYGKYYSAFDDKVHDGVSYNDYSLWDTFRAEHPLLQLIQPKRVEPMITAMLQMYKEGGWLPDWPNPSYTGIMIGTHADEVIADAFVNGFRGFDVALAYEAMRKDSFMPPNCDTLKWYRDRDRWTSNEARAGLTYYHGLGYIPVDKTAESVSRTIEYSYEDFAVAQVAKALGKTEDYERLIAFSKNYKNLYNKTTGFMAPRTFNGEWGSDPNAGFTEGSNWTYTFGAMHDVEGMIELMGGSEKFSAKLDENFAQGHYCHDNEPGHHYIYLYDYCGQPWKTQELARKHVRANYHNSPSGINGNDDCGQMSAWYLFGAMGFYPVTPAAGYYAIGAPQFPKITLLLTKGGQSKRFEIVAHNLSEANLYVQSATLDGQPITRPFLKCAQLMNGHKLTFEMGPKPNYDWK